MSGNGTKSQLAVFGLDARLAQQIDRKRPFLVGDLFVEVVNFSRATIEAYLFSVGGTTSESKKPFAPHSDHDGTNACRSKFMSHRRNSLRQPRSRTGEADAFAPRATKSDGSSHSLRPTYRIEPPARRDIIVFGEIDFGLTSIVYIGT
jgi:hypothetical protein